MNSLVDEPKKYFIPELKPIEVKILDASFERNGEELYVIPGLWDYFTSRNVLNANNPQSKFFNDKYSNILLNILLKEIDEREEIEINYEKEQQHSPLYNMKINLDQDNNIAILGLNPNKDSCIALINKVTLIYRQSINGREILGIETPRQIK